MPFLKIVEMSLSSCSLSVGQMVLIKYASNTLRFKFSGALLMMVDVDLLVGFFFKCLAGSNFLFLSFVHFIVFYHYKLVLQCNFVHRNNLYGKWHNYNDQPYLLMEIVTVLSLCSKQH